MLNFKYRKHSNRSLDTPKIRKINIYKFYIVYKTINLISGKEYIGTHVSNYLMDDYIGSGSELNKDIEELGIENFKRFNIQVFYNHHDMVECERRLVDSSYLSRPDTYNIAKGGSNLSCSGIDEKYLDKIRKKCVDYEIEDYSKLIDHLCILRNELIYTPDIKRKMVSFKKAGEMYYNLYKRSVTDPSLIDEMNALVESQDLLKEALNYFDIESIAKTQFNSTFVKDRMHLLNTIESIKGTIENDYGVYEGLIISKGDLLEIVKKINKDYGFKHPDKMSFMNNFMKLSVKW